ncbi:hypothetical protein DFH07DRAFT_821515 [Mycena maculata]|uniref:Uncharacterized protein n=1 Tax=Mycena maculata TaxID=230809 RepID=A0AAD7J6R8_9AGAR|nr:hypothetical protein DFH07DRAFT_821515 [Mycena maculata]
MTRTTTMRNFESQGLSATRISRLLRPLRTKCSALTTHPCHARYRASTYGSKACSADASTCPLDILPPPDTIRSYHLDHRSAASLRAAIYAVRDCFRDIVLKTKSIEAIASASRVTRLADLCSIIVGQNLQGEGEDFGGDAEGDVEQLSDMENLYEFIPVQYRRSALLAHALDIILRCPNHFTLLNIILDVSLQCDLYLESCLLLRRLLEVAVSPAPFAVALCHPAHSNYLVDLFQKWRANRPTSVLIRILTETLVKAARPELWCCKALSKFSRQLHNQDFESLLDMAGKVVSSIPHVERDWLYENAKRKRRPYGREEFSLTDQLNRWMNYSPICPPNSQDSARLEFLEKCRQSRVHKNTDSLAATITCWATHYLSVPTQSPDIHTSISRLLQDVSPTVTTYNLLVESSFGTKHKLEDSRRLLQTYSACLQAENLLLLDASLSACVLRFVETMYFAGHCGARKEVILYREELMDSVEHAESRCFGRRLNRPEPRWRWEETPGCWHPVYIQDPAFATLHTTTTFDALHDEGMKTDNPHYDDSPTSSFELSFKSLVSSALSNRTRLHGRTVSKQAFSIKNSTRFPPHRVVSTLLSPTCTNFDIPTSDDALDLFQYPGSSPISCLD